MFFKKLLVMVLIFTIITIPVTSYSDEMGQYMKDTLEQLGNLAPHAYQGQERGYFVGGSLSTRIPTDIIQPFSYTPPHFHVGCNGIDIVMGGFSYLNFDYIVKKLQSILQAAPFLAFDIAIQTLCEQCRAAMNAAEHFSQLVNKLNFDSCKSAEALVAALTPETIRRKIIGKASASKQQEGSADGFWSALDDAIENVDSAIDYYAGQYDAMINGVDLNALQPYDPSLLENACKAAGVAPGLYANFLRAAVGDIVKGDVIGGTGDTTLYQPLEIESCYGDTKFNGPDIIAGFLDGEFQIREIGTQCTWHHMDPTLDETIKDMLDNIYNKISTGGELDEYEINLINMSPVPVYRFLLMAYMTGDDAIKDIVIDKLTPILATGTIYVAISRIVNGASRMLRQYKNFANKENIVGKKVSDEHIEKMLKRLSALKSSMWKEYRAVLGKNTFADFWNQYLALQARVTNALQKANLLRSYQLQGMLQR